MKSTHLIGSLLLLSTLTWSSAAYAGNPRMTLDEGTLTIDCQSEDCTAFVTQVGSRLHIFKAGEKTDNNGNPILVQNTWSAPKERYYACAYDDVAEIYFSGSGHPDLFANATDIPVVARGGDGDDWIVGGSGNDDLDGGDGGDRLEGGPGDDDIRGGSGNDILYGGAGDDELYGQRGRDELRGHHGDDDLYGGPGNDKLYGGPGNDSLHGGKGKGDYCTGGESKTGCEKN